MQGEYDCSMNYWQIVQWKKIKDSLIIDDCKTNLHTSYKSHDRKSN